MTGDNSAKAALKSLMVPAMLPPEVPARVPADPREALMHYEKLLREQTEHLELLHEDLQLARELQQAMLPLQYPTFPHQATPEESAFLFHHAYRANDAIGGDFFALLPLSQTLVGVFLCDVMGHGVRSALVTAMIRAMLEEFKPIAHEPGPLLNELNRSLSEILRRARTPVFTSAFYLVANAQTGLMHYANAGHPIPMHASRNAQCVTELDCEASSGPALGMIEDADYQTCELQLAQGDVMFLFTDGLFEIKGAEKDTDEDFGTERVLGSLQKGLENNPQTPLAALCDGVLQDAIAFAGELDDDLCFIAVEMARVGLPPQTGRDDITGLYDANFLQESMEREVSRAERKGYQVGVITLNLRGLEEFTKQRGQGVADEMLREFGALLQRCTRRSDIACRVCAAGFTLVLPEASIASTERKAAQILEWISTQGRAYFDDAPLSLMLGLASFPQHGASAEAIVQAAAEAMKECNSPSENQGKLNACPPTR